MILPQVVFARTLPRNTSSDNCVFILISSSFILRTVLCLLHCYANIIYVSYQALSQIYFRKAYGKIITVYKHAEELLLCSILAFLQYLANKVCYIDTYSVHTILCNDISYFMELYYTGWFQIFSSDD